MPGNEPTSEAQINSTGLQEIDENLKRLPAISISGFRDRELAADELRFLIEFDSSEQIQERIDEIQACFQHNAAHIERLFTSDNASLENFYILRFALSSGALSYAEACDLAHALKESAALRSCEVDQSAVEIFAENGLQQIDEQAAAPSDQNWALKNIRVSKAWKLARKRGEGISIAIPGCGIEMNAKNNTGATNFDLIAGDAGAAAGFGHGVKTTAMASLAVGCQLANTSGTAPHADVVFIRAANSETEYSSVALARAIEKAIDSGCRIIVLGCSGFYCHAMEMAIQYALNANVIVIAAAGDNAGAVAYPARYSRVAAIAGSTAHDLPWDVSASGREISFVAPAEHVWMAKPDVDGTVLNAGNGTALAAALGAGAAALWLEYHGVSEVEELARKRRSTVQALFLSAVALTARQPNKWDNSRYGAGIIDCEALVKLALTDIPDIETPTTFLTEPEHSIVSLVQESTAQVPNTRNINLLTHAPEISALAYRKMSGDTNIGEAGPRVSKNLQAAVEASGDRALKHLIS